MITDKIQQMIGEALKAHDEIRLSTLRLLSSAFNYEFIARQHKLSEEEELAVVRREAKKRKEAIEALRQAQGKPTTSGTNLDDRISREQKELEILQEFLPTEMSDEELEKLIDQAIKEVDLPAGATHQALQAGMGKVIGVVMAKTKGSVEGGRVAGLVKNKLS